MRWADRCCSTWVSASVTWLSVVAIWTRATSTWACWALSAACEASYAVRALSRSWAATSPLPNSSSSRSAWRRSFASTACALRQERLLVQEVRLGRLEVRAGHLEACLGARQRRPRLVERVLHLGRLDLDQERAGLHELSPLDVDRPDVAGRLREDRGLPVRVARRP